MNRVLALAAVCLGSCAHQPAAGQPGPVRPTGYGYAFRIGVTFKPLGISIGIVPVMKPEEVAATLLQK